VHGLWAPDRPVPRRVRYDEAHRLSFIPHWTETVPYRGGRAGAVSARARAVRTSWMRTPPATITRAANRGVHSQRGTTQRNRPRSEPRHRMPLITAPTVRSPSAVSPKPPTDPFGGLPSALC